MAMEEFISSLSSAVATLSFVYSTATMVFIYAMFREHFPQHLQDEIEKYGRKLSTFVYPYTQITFDEFTGEHLNRSEAFAAIKNYLSCKSSASAKRLKADALKDSQSVVLSMDYNEEITDEFNNVKYWWSAGRTTPRSFQILMYPAVDERRYYKLTFHSSIRECIYQSYLHHVQTEGKTIERQNRVRKLYSNNPSKHWSGYNQTKWSHVAFEHPALFDTLAMEAQKKEEIKNDLLNFSKGKDYYARIGKAWKRGYLLFGPPGTGKSTLIAAMANFLKYDVYDLELTAVKDNTELRRLFIETTNKSIIVIEDIDCSLDLTGQRENKKRKRKSEQEKEDEDELGPINKKLKEEETKDSEVNLSGVLNVIDGLWSACGGERIIVFTTNYVEKLDPALVRRGRMDKKIAMSYCCFEAFKVLAKNYLRIDSHPLFEEIGKLLGETNMSPADVAENLMTNSEDESETEAEKCLKKLIEALELAKEEEGNKAKEGHGSGTKEKRKRSGNSMMKKNKKRTIR